MTQVSVILPNHNHSSFLSKRINSIINQTFQDFELIILDDASTDESKEIIEIYRNNPKVSAIVYNEKNSGSVYRQWQKGLGLAKGEWIWIAESDDYCSLEFLARLLSTSTNNINLIFCPSFIVNENDGIIGEQKLSIAKSVISAEEFVPSFMYYDNSIVNASAVLFKKSLALERWNNEIFRLRLGGDWFFWSNIIKGGNILFHPVPLNFYRKHPITVSNESIKKGLWLTNGVVVQDWIEANYEITKEKRKELSRILYKRFFKERMRIAQQERKIVFGTVWRKLFFFEKMKSIVRLMLV